MRPLSERWRAANNGSGARMWFVVTDDGRHHVGRAGQLVRYGSFGTADSAAHRLNIADVLNAHERLSFLRQLAELRELVIQGRELAIMCLEDVFTDAPEYARTVAALQEHATKLVGDTASYADADDEEPDGAGYPDMDSAGGDGSLNRAYKEK